MCRSDSNSNDSSNVTKSSSSSLGSARPAPPNRPPQTSDDAGTNSQLYCCSQHGDSSAPDVARHRSGSCADRTIQRGRPLRQRVRNFSATSSSALIPRKPRTALALRASIAFALISACAGWVISGGNIARVAHLFRAGSGPLYLGTWTEQVRTPADTRQQKGCLHTLRGWVKLSRVCIGRTVRYYRLEKGYI